MWSGQDLHKFRQRGRVDQCKFDELPIPECMPNTHIFPLSFLPLISRLPIFYSLLSNSCTLCSTKTKRPDISYVPLRQSCDVQLSSQFEPVRLLKTRIFENVLLSSRRSHGRIMNLFRKLKLSCTCSNSTSLPTPQPSNKAGLKPPSVQTSPAHASYA